MKKYILLLIFLTVVSPFAYQRKPTKMKNLRNLPIFTCLFLLVLIPLSAESLPPPSPAGGNYLVLDGVDDHAILDFETFGLLLPKGTDEFTFEAWIYPTTHPNRDIHAMVLSQQVWVDVLSRDHEEFENLKTPPGEPEGDLMLRVGAHLAEPGVDHSIMWFRPIKFSPNQWNHIAFQSGDTRKIIIINDFVRIYPRQITLADDISRAGLPQDFILGGFREKIEFHGGQFQDTHFWGHFAGYIDEVRISKVARYNIAKRNFTPQKKFENDAKTIALWHFDEPRGARKFLDTSGNAYHLVGKNGAKTDGALAVEAEGKLATIWGRLKR